MSVKYVMQLKSHDQKQHPMTVCLDVHFCAAEDPKLLANIVTGK